MNWEKIVKDQQCVYLNKKCYKVRKSDPGTAIGSCAVLHGRESEPIIICPTRLLERHQIFTDCFHLLTVHEPGNELHIVSEISIPGGSVDYFLVSAKNQARSRTSWALSFKRSIPLALYGRNVNGS